MNPIATLGMNIVAQPRVFAVLLGSGASRSAGIPTGYEVTVDLIRRYAQAHGEDPGDDPEAWFAQHVGRPSRYSDLLSGLSPTAAGRQALLKHYFEPTDEDRELGRKQPTPAHRVLARMVREGLISIILTPNFDRLMERALEDEGITPVVISTVGALDGAPPPQHNACTVVKLHGDYLELSIRNTDDELANYPEGLNRYLDRILDEYGLIVVGWSAEWDGALRDAFERRASKRYQHYWILRSQPNEFQKKLITNHGAVVIDAPSADAFFDDLERAIEGARGRALASPRAMSTDAAVAALKAVIADDSRRIQLHDLLAGQTEALVEATTSDRFRVDVAAGAEEVTAESAVARMSAYEALAEPLVALVANGLYWAREGQHEMFFDIIRRVAEAAREGTGRVKWIQLQRYPALLLTYAAGIALVAAKREDLLLKLWGIPIREPNGDELTAVYLNPWKVIEHDFARSLPSMPGERLISPMSDYLLIRLREVFRSLLPAQMDFEAAFDRFEYLSALVQSHHTNGGWHRWFYVGRFSWQGRFDTSAAVKRVEAEVESLGTSWPLLAAGLFGGDVDAFMGAKKDIDEQARQMGFR